MQKHRLYSRAIQPGPPAMLLCTLIQHQIPACACFDHAETVSIGKDGTLYLPDSQGRIWTAENGEGKLRELAYVGGKPLGGHVYPDGDVIFCDAVKVNSNASGCYAEMDLSQLFVACMHMLHQ